MLKLARNYDVKDRKIKSESGTTLLDITRDKIVGVFKLNPNYIVRINFYYL